MEELFQSLEKLHKARAGNVGASSLCLSSRDCWRATRHACGHGADGARAWSAQIGIVHRDIKPSNMLIDGAADGPRKVCDQAVGFTYESGIPLPRQLRTRRLC